MGNTIAKKKRHHYISRFYLNGFIDPNNDPYIWVYEKGNSNIVKATVENIAVQKHFYSHTTPEGDVDSETLENILAELEGLAAPVVQKIKAHENLNEQERVYFALFLTFTMTRVPNFRKNVEEATAERIKKVLIKYASNAESFKSLIEKAKDKIDKPLPIKMLRAFALDSHRYDIKVDPQFSLGMIGLALDFAPLFFSMKWKFLIATDDYKFITSDNPLFYLDPEYDPESLRGGGLISKTVQVAFPVSKDFALLATWKNGEGYIQVDNSQVKEINRRTVISALRFVFSSQKSKGLNRLVQKYKDGTPRIEVIELEKNIIAFTRKI